MSEADTVSARARDAVEALRQNLTRIAERKPRVLIVDDEENDAYLLRSQIRTECVPCDIEVAHDCERALEMIRKTKYDVVFLDLRFKGMSGVELLRQVGDETARIPFLAFSGLNDGAKELQDALTHGAYGLFRKPFSNLQIKSICGLVNA